jgi:hypothetical protein
MSLKKRLLFNSSIYIYKALNSLCSLNSIKFFNLKTQWTSSRSANILELDSKPVQWTGKIYNKFGSLKPVTDFKVSFKMNRKNITKTVVHLIIVATRFALVITGYTLVTSTPVILSWPNIQISWPTIQELYNCKIIEAQTYIHIHTHTYTHTHTHTYTHTHRERERERFWILYM